MTRETTTKKNAFSRKATSNPFDKEGSFERDESDNPIFKNIQVNNLSDIITENCEAYYDADTLIFQACTNVQTSYITVKHKDGAITEDMKNVTLFKGAGKGIKEGSWLYRKNLEREVEGKEPYTLDDFEIEDNAKLNYKTEEEAFERAKIDIFTKLKKLRNQFDIKNIVLVLGEGDNFRHDLDLCRAYKGNRKEIKRPIILNKVRQWAVETLKTVQAQPRWDGKPVEADDVVEYYGSLGYQNYKKTGKFNYLVIASDKDALNNPKLLISPDKHTGKDNPKRGKYKLPQPLLIQDSSVDVGSIEVITKTASVDYKFYGFKGLLWQAFLSGDGADNYNCLSHLKQDLYFGEEAAYKVLMPCKTAKEALQATIDVFAKLLPYGVQYTTHDGRELDIPTIEYMNTYFKVAYMLRHDRDQMDFYKLCKAFKVDISKIEDNNRYTAPLKTYKACETTEDIIIALQKNIEESLTGHLKAYKSKKKSELVEKLDELKEVLQNSLSSLEGFYEMKQKLKEGFSPK